MDSNYGLEGFLEESIPCTLPRNDGFSLRASTNVHLFNGVPNHYTVLLKDPIHHEQRAPLEVVRAEMN